MTNEGYLQIDIHEVNQGFDTGKSMIITFISYIFIGIFKDICFRLRFNYQYDYHDDFDWYCHWFLVDYPPQGQED